MTIYSIKDTSQIISPALVVFQEPLTANIAEMKRIAGDTQRLRPHCKTHKMSAVIGQLLDQGITKHKAATFAEAEMLATAGVKDVFLAYNLVGPNIVRAVKFQQRYPDVRFSVTADHATPIADLAKAMEAAGQTVYVFLDIDTGQHRTGVAAGPQAAALYEQIHTSPGLRAAGLHVYDGHQHQRKFEDRQRAVLQEWSKIREFRADLESRGLPIERIVSGGTGSFPVYAELDDPGIECSPGTCVFHDTGYGTAFPDLKFTPAAVVLTRVVSRPTPDRLTLDLGYKAIASDPPHGERLSFPELPDAQAVLQNEEHLVVTSTAANNYAPGDELIAIPRHICPTSALHKQVWVIQDGQVVDRWTVDARDRWLNI